MPPEVSRKPTSTTQASRWRVIRRLGVTWVCGTARVGTIIVASTASSPALAQVEVDEPCAQVETLRTGSDAHAVFDAAQQCLTTLDGNAQQAVLRVRVLLSLATAAELIHRQTDLGYYLDVAAKSYQEAVQLAHSQGRFEEFDFAQQHMASLRVPWQRARARAWRAIARGNPPSPDSLPDPAYLQHKRHLLIGWASAEIVVGFGILAIVVGNWSELFRSEDGEENAFGPILGGAGLLATGALATLSTIQLRRAYRANHFVPTPSAKLTLGRENGHFPAISGAQFWLHWSL